MWKKYGLVIGALVVALVAIVYYAVQFASYQPKEATPPEQELSPSAPTSNAGGAGTEAPAAAADIPPAQLEGLKLPPQQPPVPTEAVPPSGNAGNAGGAGAPTTNAGTPPPAPASTVISYDGKAYAPATIGVKKGDLVMFVNKGTTEMWPASAMHPTHAVYPTTGGCIGSTFDACVGIPAGGSWSFVFDQAGAWKYHDHLNPSVRGTVNVK